MTNLVPSSEIEEIVGFERHATYHYGRAVSEEQTFYILHSYRCVNTTPDLRHCKFSRALDEGFEEFPPEDVSLGLVVLSSGMLGWWTE